ncbi:MAG: four helix bundle protein [Planctomycetes bacterium]|nr:four helix bundle protein [Planctomycetota bacterium]
MTEEEFLRRTKRVALRVIRLVDALPKARTAGVIGAQLLRAGTSVGANYRAACRSVSTADMISKLGDVEEETDESVYWMELLIEAGIVPEQRLKDLVGEMREILAMVVASIKTLRSRNPKPKGRGRGS